MRRLIVLALLAFPAAAGAQAGTIAPGMTRAQVVSSLGEPATSRVANEFTYLFYRNDCGKACGMNDLVVLRSDSVIDAIFRSPSRRYTGKSSSPAPLTRGEARSGVASAKPMAVSKPATTASATPAQAIPMKKDVPTPAAAPAAAPAASATSAATRTPTPEQLAKLRRDLLGSGLTATQIRTRLREQGYPEHLLDADMRGAAAAQAAAPASKMKPGAPNDTRPSIPAGPPPVRPAAPGDASTDTPAQ